VEVGQELGPLGSDDQVERPIAPVAEPVPHMTPEPPRRRSTIREPAPSFTSGQGFTPPPEPAPQSTSETHAQPAESDNDETKPRKTGWWAKRMFGDKG
jgi:ribonuclease E